MTTRSHMHGGHKPDLVDLEEKLASQGSLNPKEEKLHKLIKVELGERRGVEEIGLALLGGRFSLDTCQIVCCCHS